MCLWVKGHWMLSVCQSSGCLNVPGFLLMGSVSLPTLGAAEGCLSERDIKELLQSILLLTVFSPVVLVLCGHIQEKKEKNSLKSKH